MAAGDTQITITGNLVDDPELRFTPSGQPVAKFRVASTPRFLDKNTNEWKDGDSLFLTCNVWRQAAENAAESLTRGMRVIVSGRLRWLRRRRRRPLGVRRQRRQLHRRAPVLSLAVPGPGPTRPWASTT